MDSSTRGIHISAQSAGDSTIDAKGVRGSMAVDYAEGDWFGVPLPEGQYGTCLVARAQPEYGGVLLGYFFGPRSLDPPPLARVRLLTPASAAMVCLFGHLDIRRGRWPLVGRLPEWDRDQWPMPKFIRKPGLGGPAILVVRSNNNPNVTLSETAVHDASSAADAVPEGLLGSALAAKVLARRI